MSDEEVPLSGKGSVPAWLKGVYGILLVWGVVWFILNFDGPWSYVDPGAWKELEKAAHTTFEK
jgi:hypothetical protein